MRTKLFVLLMAMVIVTAGCNAFAEHELDVDREIVQKLSPSVGYNEAYDGQLVEELSRSIEEQPEVEDVRVLVSGPTIIVGVLTYEKNKQEVEQKIRKTVDAHVGEYELQIIFDNETFSRTEQVKENLEEIVSPNPVQGNRTNYLER